MTIINNIYCLTDTGMVIKTCRSYTTVQKFGVKNKKKNTIYSFVQDAFNYNRKVTVNTFIMLQNISVSNN